MRNTDRSLSIPLRMHDQTATAGTADDVAVGCDTQTGSSICEFHTYTGMPAWGGSQKRVNLTQTHTHTPLSSPERGTN